MILNVGLFHYPQTFPPVLSSLKDEKTEGHEATFLIN